MKHKVKIPKSVDIAGHSYLIRFGSRINKELESAGFRGTHSDFLREIDIRRDLTPQEKSCTFVHEILHAVDTVYSGSCLSETENKSIANGLHQVLEQLGVRFVK